MKFYLNFLFAIDVGTSFIQKHKWSLSEASQMCR